MPWIDYQLLYVHIIVAKCSFSFTLSGFKCIFYIFSAECLAHSFSTASS